MTLTNHTGDMHVSSEEREKAKTNKRHRGAHICVPFIIEFDDRGGGCLSKVRAVRGPYECQLACVRTTAAVTR